MNTALQLLNDLTLDPFKLDDFLSDPLALDTAITVEDLQRFARDGRPVLDDGWVRCASCFDPGTDPLPDPDVPMPPSA